MSYFHFAYFDFWKILFTFTLLTLSCRQNVLLSLSQLCPISSTFTLPSEVNFLLTLVECNDVLQV